MNFFQLVWREPWLAPVVLNLRNVIETKRISTAGVTPDGKTLYYNPVFWKSLSQEEQLGVQIHEMLHIVNRHAARKGSRRHMLWNIACDMAINDQIKRSGYTLPSGALSGEQDTAEAIYNRLLQKNDLKSSGKRHGKAVWYNEFGDQYDSDFSNDLLEHNADGSNRCKDDSTLEAIEDARRLAMQGNGNSSLIKQFMAQAAKANWKSVLQSMVKSAVGDDMDYLSYEFDEFGICEDVFSAKPQSKICVLVDESGSIDDDLYEQFLGELYKMLQFALVYASGFADNTQLHAVPVKTYRRTMTGGTDLTISYQQACEKDFDCIIVLTDGYLSFPDKEPKPTIWAMPESFGRKQEVIF